MRGRSSGSERGQEQSDMECRKRIFIILLTLFFCIAGDQFTKFIVGMDLPRERSMNVVKGILNFDYVVNKGGVFAFE